jgi:hypothetical protein
MAVEVAFPASSTFEAHGSDGMAPSSAAASTAPAAVASTQTPQETQMTGSSDRTTTRALAQEQSTVAPPDTSRHHNDTVEPDGKVYWFAVSIVLIIWSFAMIRFPLTSAYSIVVFVGSVFAVLVGVKIQHLEDTRHRIDRIDRIDERSNTLRVSRTVYEQLDPEMVRLLTSSRDFTSAGESNDKY